jgi:hypothetical protein
VYTGTLIIHIEEKLKMVGYVHLCPCGPEVPELLSRAMIALQARPVLYRYCVEEVSRTRWGRCIFKPMLKSRWLQLLTHIR